MILLATLSVVVATTVRWSNSSLPSTYPVTESSVNTFPASSVPSSQFESSHRVLSSSYSSPSAYVRTVDFTTSARTAGHSHSSSISESLTKYSGKSPAYGSSLTFSSFKSISSGSSIPLHKARSSSLSSSKSIVAESTYPLSNTLEASKRSKLIISSTTSASGTILRTQRASGSPHSGAQNSNRSFRLASSANTVSSTSGELVKTSTNSSAPTMVASSKTSTFSHGAGSKSDLKASAQYSKPTPSSISHDKLYKTSHLTESISTKSGERISGAWSPNSSSTSTTSVIDSQRISKSRYVAASNAKISSRVKLSSLHLSSGTELSSPTSIESPKSLGSHTLSKAPASNVSTVLTTYCPSPTTFTIGGSTYSISSAGTVTLTLPCSTGFQQSEIETRSDTQNSSVSSHFSRAFNTQYSSTRFSDYSPLSFKSLKLNSGVSESSFAMSTHGAQTHSPNSHSTNTEASHTALTVYTTFCPSPTTFTIDNSVYSITSPTAVTLTCQQCLKGASSSLAATSATSREHQISTLSSLARHTTTLPGSLQPAVDATSNLNVDGSRTATIATASQSTASLSPVFSSSTDVSDVTIYTTFCPSPTTFTIGSSAYSVTSPTTLTITCHKSHGIPLSGTRLPPYTSSASYSYPVTSELKPSYASSDVLPPNLHLSSKPGLSTSASSSSWSISESVVSGKTEAPDTVYTTYCPSPTVFTVGSSVYSVSKESTLTITCSKCLASTSSEVDTATVNLRSISSPAQSMHFQSLSSPLSSLSLADNPTTVPFDTSSNPSDITSAQSAAATSNNYEHSVSQYSQLTLFTTFCPSPTTFTFASSTYTVSEATTLTIPCACSHETSFTDTPTISPSSALQQVTVSTTNIPKTTDRDGNQENSLTTVVKSVHTKMGSSVKASSIDETTYTVTSATTLTLTCSSSKSSFDSAVSEGSLKSRTSVVANSVASFEANSSQGPSVETTHYSSSVSLEPSTTQLAQQTSPGASIPLQANGAGHIQLGTYAAVIIALVAVM